MYFIVVGAGHTGRHVIERILEMGDKLTVIEKSEELCRELSKIYAANIIEGDGTNPEILRKADISTADYVIVATDSSGANISICKLAKSFGVPKVIVFVINPKNKPEFIKAGADILICPLENALAIFESTIKRLDAVTLLHKDDENYKVVEFTVYVGSPLVGKKLIDIRLPEKCRVGLVRRGGEMIFPDEKLVLTVNDRLFLHGTIEGVEKAVDLLRSRI